MKKYLQVNQNTKLKDLVKKQKRLNLQEKHLKWAANLTAGNKKNEKSCIKPRKRIVFQHIQNPVTKFPHLIKGNIISF